MGFIGSFPIRISNIWSPPWERILHNIVPKASLNWNKTSQKDLWGDFTLFGKSVLPLDLNLKRSSLWRKMHFHRNFSGVGKLKCCWPEYKSKLFWHKSQKSLKILLAQKPKVFKNFMIMLSSVLNKITDQIVASWKQNPGEIAKSINFLLGSVAELGSLSSGAKMAISASNASFLRVIANLQN